MCDLQVLFSTPEPEASSPDGVLCSPCVQSQYYPGFQWFRLQIGPWLSPILSRFPMVQVIDWAFAVMSRTSLVPAVGSRQPFLGVLTKLLQPHALTLNKKIRLEESGQILFHLLMNVKSFKPHWSKYHSPSNELFL